jgi:ubiquinone biosynthesis protein
VRLRLLDAFRDANRARQIIHILLFKYGFYRVAAELGLVRVLPIRRWRLRAQERYERMNPGERLRLAMVDLGPAFVKLAQALSTRADFTPPAIIAELRRLQDDVPPVDFSEIEAVLREELGPDWAAKFARFEREPVASASLGQVYQATLLDGTPAIVKVQRPGVEQAVERDLRFLDDLARLVHHRSAAMRRYGLPDFAREFASIIHDELNYTIEAHNAKVMADLLSHRSGVTVPRVVDELTTRRVLTTERLTGTHMDPDHLRARGFDPNDVAERYSRAILEMVFEHGFFHGDPHQGNVLVLDDGRIGFLDLGMVGRLSPAAVTGLRELLFSVFELNADGAIDVCAELGAAGDEVDFQGARRALARLLTRYYFLPRKHLRLGETLGRILRLVNEYDIRLPSEFTLLAKALLVAEGVASQLNPDFDYNEVARPLVGQLAREEWTSERALRELWRGVREARRQVMTIPRRLSHLMGEIESGALRVRVKQEELGQTNALHVTLAHRIAASVLIGAALVAYVLWATSPMSGRWPSLWVTVAGAAVGTVAGVALLYFIVRSRR